MQSSHTWESVEDTATESIKNGGAMMALQGKDSSTHIPQSRHTPETYLRPPHNMGTLLQDRQLSGQLSLATFYKAAMPPLPFISPIFCSTLAFFRFRSQDLS